MISWMTFWRGMKADGHSISSCFWQMRSAFFYTSSKAYFCQRDQYSRAFAWPEIYSLGWGALVACAGLARINFCSMISIAFQEVIWIRKRLFCISGRWKYPAISAWSFLSWVAPKFVFPKSTFLRWQGAPSSLEGMKTSLPATSLSHNFSCYPSSETSFASNSFSLVVLSNFLLELLDWRTSTSEGRLMSKTWLAGS